jgi:predicted dehydrogenase
MGLSHLAMVRATPGVEVVGVCDSSGYLLGGLRRYTGLATYSGYEKMLDEVHPDAVVIATPSNLHGPMVRAALDRGVHVFCEKPFCLDPEEGAELATRALEVGLVTQVGYHNRFVGAFREVKSLLDQGAIGEVVHVMGEAYGPVVLKPQGSTWRTNRAAGGGSLYDYAAHPLNLVNWYLGEPTAVGGTVLRSIFSRSTDDAVFTTLDFAGRATAQLCVNWSDESVRKMTTQVTLWGTAGRIYADRQECHVFLRPGSAAPPGYQEGWNVRYTTELTEPVAFYLRGEEYSGQLEAFARRVAEGAVAGENDFESAVVTDRSLQLMREDAARGMAAGGGALPAGEPLPEWLTTARRWKDKAVASPVGVKARGLADAAQERWAKRRVG